MTDSPAAEQPEYSTDDPTVQALVLQAYSDLDSTFLAGAESLIDVGVPVEWAITGQCHNLLTLAAMYATAVAVDILGRAPDRAKWDAACAAAWDVVAQARAEPTESVPTKEPT